MFQVQEAMNRASKSSSAAARALSASAVDASPSPTVTTTVGLVPNPEIRKHADDGLQKKQQRYQRQPQSPPTTSTCTYPLVSDAGTASQGRVPLAALGVSYGKVSPSPFSSDEEGTAILSLSPGGTMYSPTRLPSLLLASTSRHRPPVIEPSSSLALVTVTPSDGNIKREQLLLPRDRHRSSSTPPSHYSARSGSGSGSSSGDSRKRAINEKVIKLATVPLVSGGGFADGGEADITIPCSPSAERPYTEGRLRYRDYAAGLSAATVLPGEDELELEKVSDRPVEADRESHSSTLKVAAEIVQPVNEEKEEGAGSYKRFWAPATAVRAVRGSGGEGEKCDAGGPRVIEIANDKVVVSSTENGTSEQLSDESPMGQGPSVSLSETANAETSRGLEQNKEASETPRCALEEAAPGSIPTPSRLVCTAVL